MSVVRINAIPVARERFPAFEQTFAARAGKVEDAPGFEGLELLRPNEDRGVCMAASQRWSFDVREREAGRSPDSPAA